MIYELGRKIAVGNVEVLAINELFEVVAHELLQLVEG
jgi:hypothetical protein